MSTFILAEIKIKKAFYKQLLFNKSNLVLSVQFIELKNKKCRRRELHDNQGEE